MNATTLSNLIRSRLATGAKSVLSLLFVWCAVLLGAMTAQAQNTNYVYVDPSQAWIGYMNWSPLATHAPGYGTNGAAAWNTVDLDASFTNAIFPNVAFLTANTSIARDVTKPNPIWWNADGSGANNMDANFYVESGTFTNRTVVFSGNCVENTLVSPYTSVAFIKDFAADYSSFTVTNVALVTGTPFSISLATGPAGHHIQYGFETVGPNAPTTDASGLGDVAIETHTVVVVDANKTWGGYMTWTPDYAETVDNGGSGSSVWGTADLQAYFASGTNLYLFPCTNVYNPTDPYWVNADGTGANKMDANFYVTDETGYAVSGTTLEFNGVCRSRTLDPAYTSQAFIKLFADGYSYLGGASVDLVDGQPFSVSMNTYGAVHVQYGFETIGPDANPTNVLGKVSLAAIPAIPAAPGSAPTNNAPTPTWPASAVLSMYNSSHTYTDHPVYSWLASWSGSGGGTFTITNTSRIVKYYYPLAYAGVEFYANGDGGNNTGTNFNINVTDYDHFHVDVWTPDANQFGIQLVSLNPTVGPQVDFLPASGVITNRHWISLDIPLTQFTAVNPALVLSDLEQLLWIDNQVGGIQGGHFYIDNVYFYNSFSCVITASVSGANLNLAFPTQLGHTYTVQWKNNLTDSTWQTFNTYSGTGSTVTATDSHGLAHRFYQVSIQ